MRELRITQKSSYHYYHHSNFVGAMESDYPTDEDLPSETNDDAASASSGGSDSGFGNVNLVTASTPATPSDASPTSEPGL